MARYRSVEPKLLGDPRLEPLTDLAGLVHVHLLAGPSALNLPGLINAGVGTIADSVRRRPEDVEAALQELVTAGIIKADFQRRLLWVEGAMPTTPARSDKTVKGWFATWDALPESALKLDYARALARCVERASGAACGAWRGTFGAAFPLAGGPPETGGPPSGGGSPPSDSPNDARSQEQKQEQQQKPEKEQELEQTYGRPSVLGLAPNPPQIVELDEPELDEMAIEVIRHLDARRRAIYPSCDDRPSGKRARMHIVSFLRDHVAETGCTTRVALRRALDTVDARAAHVESCSDPAEREGHFAHLTETAPFRTEKARAVSAGLVDRQQARRLERERAEQAREHERERDADSARKRAEQDAAHKDLTRKLLADEIPIPASLRRSRSGGKA